MTDKERRCPNCGFVLEYWGEYEQWQSDRPGPISIYDHWHCWKCGHGYSETIEPEKVEVRS